MKNDFSGKNKVWLYLFFFAFYLVLSFINRLVLNKQKLTNNSSAAGNLATVNFQASGEDIANPERGFMKQSNISVDQPFNPSSIGKVQATDTVNWVYFHLENYRDPRDGKGVTLTNYQGKPLEAVGSGKGLDTVNNTFNEARNKGLKLVIRFLYVGYGGIGSTSDFANAEPDAPLSLALQHINQLAPLINQNKDVIVTVQAGMVGYWGEWHSSKYLSPLPNRKAVTDEWLKLLTKDRMLQVRYPKYVQNFYGGPVSAAQSFDQSNLSRIGFYDDAFVKDDTDDGTFTANAMGQTISNYCNSSANITQCWRDYYSQTSQFTPSGGEAGTHSGSASSQADCPNSLIQLNNLHFSFLHNGFSMVTLNNWVNQGCMPEIKQRMGYRFVLSKLSLAQQVAPGGNLEFHLELENKGFASPFNPRPAILVLKNTGSAVQKEIPLTSVDIRKWLPGQTVKVDLNIPLPQDLPIGTYIVYLWLPDAGAGLKTRPEYAIRMANLNMWQPVSGHNLLYGNLQVNGNQVTINPTLTNTLTPTKTRTPTPRVSISITPTPTIPVNCQTAVVPAYFAPLNPTLTTDNWYKLLNSLKNNDVVIYNPANGPGTSKNANYQYVADQAKLKNINLLGYVFTGYGTRTLSLVKSEIDIYFNWYGTKSIFFDEVSSYASDVPYYQELFNYVKSRGGLVILNPGAVPAEGYVNVSDKLVVYESEFANYIATNFSSWIFKYPAGKFVHLIYKTASASLQSTIDKSRERNAGGIYVTDDDIPNPWDTLPAYWATENNLRCTFSLKPGDANADGRVDSLDFFILVLHYLETTNAGPAVGDFNRDGKVNVLDFEILVVYYGT